MKKEIALLTAVLLFGTSAQAHVALEKSVPAQGETLTISPKTIDLHFQHPVKLVSLKLHGGKKEIALPNAHNGDLATTFSVPVPTLGVGAYEAKWSTLSSDGHAMKGSLKFTVSGK